MSKQAIEITKLQKNITEVVMDKISAFHSSGELKFPEAYSPYTAMKAAFLTLARQVDKDDKPVLKACSPESIGNALLKMVTEGLTPIKEQCYFVPYKGELTYQRSYFGDETLVKRDAGGKHITPVTIFKGDKFSYSIDVETGLKKITEHTQALESLSGDVVGAYCIIEFEDGRRVIEIMNFDQIKKAWDQRYGSNPAHKNFPDQMSNKTVIHRACKPFINTTDDSALMKDRHKNESLHEINQNANTIDIEAEEVKGKSLPEKKETVNISKQDILDGEKEHILSKKEFEGLEKVMDSGSQEIDEKAGF